MSDLIDRQAAIDAVNCVMIMKGIRSGKSVVAEAVESARSIIADNIRQLPSKRSEIICCKDCKYNYGLTHGGEFNPDDIVCTYFDTDGMQCYDFCSYGERREETE